VGVITNPLAVTMHLGAGPVVFAEVAGVSPVPVPAAVWLFGTALIGMIGFGRRRKAA